MVAPDTGSAHSARTASPYLSSFTFPIPGTFTSEPGSRGRVSAITVRVASVKMQNAGRLSVAAWCVRQVRSRSNRASS